jgi:hypothetical protein
MAKSLYTLSKLEEGRIPAVKADPRNLSDFTTLDEMIAHSLRVPNLLRTQTVTGVALKKPVLENRPFEDEAILKKLLQYRAQIPVSARIIRPQPLRTDPSEANEP